MHAVGIGSNRWPGHVTSQQQCPTSPCRVHVLTESSLALTSFSTGASGREKVASLSNLRDSTVRSNLQQYTVSQSVSPVRQTDNQTERQTDRQRDRQSDRQTDRETDHSTISTSASNLSLGTPNTLSVATSECPLY